MRFRRLLLQILLLFFTIGLYADSLKIGDKVPEIKARDVDGKSVSLSDFKDNILIIDFWATWCVPCVKEFPNFEKFYQKYKDKGVKFIAISVDNELDKVKKFAKKNKYSFTILQDIDHDTSKNFKIGLIPSLFIIGPDGLIKNDPLVGGKRNIDELLEEKIKTLFDK
jgi:peroxiredoxin